MGTGAFGVECRGNTSLVSSAAEAGRSEVLGAWGLEWQRHSAEIEAEGHLSHDHTLIPSGSWRSAPIASHVLPPGLFRHRTV